MHFLVTQSHAAVSLIVMLEISVDGHYIQVLILLHSEWFLEVFSTFEVGGLIHVQPNA